MRDDQTGGTAARGTWRSVGAVAAGMAGALAADDDPITPERRAELRDEIAVARLWAAIAVCPPELSMPVICAALDRYGAGNPVVSLAADQLRGDAAFWADAASPAELEAYVAAGLRSIERVAFCEKARKRLIVTLWETMPDAWRVEFLRRVDPTGAFLRSAA
jgi:hypothetical protein